MGMPSAYMYTSPVSSERLKPLQHTDTPIAELLKYSSFTEHCYEALSAQKCFFYFLLESHLNALLRHHS